MTTRRTERRSFLTHVGTAGAAAAAGFVVAAPAHAQTGGARFTAARHPQDDWLDAIPGEHRPYLDALPGTGAGAALLFATNFLSLKKEGDNMGDRGTARLTSKGNFPSPS